MLGHAGTIQGNAHQLPIADGSVDLIVTSPPYFALRTYTDGGSEIDGQIGSEPTPQEFLVALWTATAECWRVLKPSGSMFVNLGDKYAGSSGTSGAPSKYNATATAHRQHYRGDFGGIRAKSLMGMPWRYILGCTDGQAAPDQQQWILRAEIIWHKTNGLPESVRDRVCRSHEQWFHLTKEGRYYSALDEIREAYTDQRTSPRRITGQFGGGAVEQHPSDSTGMVRRMRRTPGDVEPRTESSLGKLPSSVWTLPIEPLKVPPELGVSHFAAFPSEWPRRLILGFSPSEICTACGGGRRTERIVEKHGDNNADPERRATIRHKGDTYYTHATAREAATQYVVRCACPTPDAPTRPAVVLDPFGGTGTTAMTARALGRVGVSVDLSWDYCRLAKWRVFESPGTAKVQKRGEH